MKRIFFIAFLAVLAVVVLDLNIKESKRIPNVYRVCKDCGLTGTEIEKLLDDFRGATEPREVLMDLYRDTFDDPSHVDCKACAEAVLDAVGIGVGVGYEPGGQ